MNTNKVEIIEGMFSLCNELEFLDLSNWDTSNLRNMDGMFASCKKLKEITGIDNFITNKVESMVATFYWCSELEYLDLSNWNTSNVKNMKIMFNNCNKLKEIKGINNFITNKVEIMDSVFVLCSELEYLDLSNWDN